MDHLLGLRKQLVQAATARGVRIAVLHRAQWLLYWIEGPAGPVESAWQRIQRLRELEAGRLLHRSLGAPVLSEPVHIATVFRREPPELVARHLAALAGTIASEGEPLRLWYEMGAPAAIPPCGCVVLASTQEHDGVELLRRIAQDHRADVVYQRFAGSDLTQFDSGAAYADFAGAGCHCTIRVQVLSRRALGHALVRGALPAVREVVLLPGNEERRVARLAESVLPLLKECAGQTRVRVIGRTLATFALADLLREADAAIDLVPCFVRSAYEEAMLLDELLQEAQDMDACVPWGGARDTLAA